MPRREHRAQAAAAVLQRVAVRDEAEVQLFHAVIFAHGRIAQEGYLLRRKAQRDILLRPVRVGRGAEALQPLAVLAAYVHPRAGRGQVPGQARVVRVQVGEEDVRVLQAHAQLREALLQGVQALGAAEAGVDEQMPPAARRADEVAVEVAQGIVRQRDGDGENIAFYLGVHVRPPCDNI